MSKIEKELYFLQPVDTLDALPSWKQEIDEKYRCVECRFYRSDFPRQVRDIYICKKMDKSALFSAYKLDIRISRREFLDIFENEAKNMLTYGKVYDENKNLLENYITYTADFMIPLRGLEISKRRKDCPVCGRIGYSVLFPCYLLRDSLSDSSIHVTWPMKGILITEELYKRIDRKKYKGIDVKKVPVLDEPVERDNFAGIPLRV